jgi:RNA polymerase sigma factor (sigma-70 family)
LKLLNINNEYAEDILLWNQLRAGDEEAFSLLFEKYYKTLVNYGRTLLDDFDMVQDCVQDVFVDLWKYRYSLKEANVIKAYLLSSVRKRIARLYERDHIFSKSKGIDSIEFSFDFCIEDRLIAKEVLSEKVRQLNLLINGLPSRQKEALYLRYHQNLSVDQVADVLNLNYQSTKNLLHRIILLLRKNFPTAIIYLFAKISSNYYFFS